MEISMPELSALERPSEPAATAPAFDPEEVRDLYREIFEAQQVQRRLGGPRRLRRGDFEIASEIFAAQHFSGDFVTIFDCGESTIVALGDIAGKGLTAAMWSTHIMGLVRTYSLSLAAPDAVLASVNRDLCALNAGVPITTMVLAQLDWQRRELAYSNAGHFCPLVARDNGKIERLAIGGPALAAIPNARFESASVAFSPSDLLVAYSDGLIECQNGKEQEFGEMRLLAQMRRVRQLPAGKALFSIIGAVQDFAETTPRKDDLSLLLIAGSHRQGRQG
jgi:sigma-B regulation protein RsbU (phosphoserine phosphatase)